MSNERARQIAVMILAVVLGVGVWLWGRSAGRHERRLLEEARRERLLPPNDRLEAPVRMVLQGRMRRHAASAERLWEAFIAVDYPAIARHATELGEEPRLGKPADDEDPALINTTIPAEFFVYQDELASSSSALARAAMLQDAAKVVDTFQRTAASCFSCHLHYRMGARHAPAP